MADDTKERYINPYTDFGFKKLFGTEINKDSDAERRQYEASQKEYWDYTSTLETAERKGEQKGIQQGIQQEKIDTAQRMKSKGFSVEDISEIAGLTIDEIKELLQ